MSNYLTLCVISFLLDINQTYSDSATCADLRVETNLSSLPPSQKTALYPCSWDRNSCEWLSQGNTYLRQGKLGSCICLTHCMATGLCGHTHNVIDMLFFSRPGLISLDFKHDLFSFFIGTQHQSASNDFGS